MAAIAGFREPHLVMNLQDITAFDDYEARMNRYDIQWGFYDNTVYRNIHSWAVRYKTISSLYINTRAIRNPSYRIGSFHQNHLWGGLLDPQAGNGIAVPSALPIITENERIRPAISKLWEASNWQIKKQLVTLFAPVMGDVGIRIVDSTKHGKVYLEVIHPRLIKQLTKDEFGNVKSYVLEEKRYHPEHPAREVTYTEISGRDDNNVVFFETLLNGSAYPWNTDANGDGISAWTVDYGFIPFVHIPHIDVGTLFGWAETHAARPKFEEIDDQASKLNDYIRKAEEGVFLFSGTVKPSGSLTPTTTTASRDKPDPKREDIPGLWGGVDAKATPLLFDLDISSTLANIEALANDIAKDYPELMIDENKELSGAISGRALRILQSGATDKIEARRPSYDNALVRAHEMAMSIGTMREYDGYKNIGTYEKGDFEHNIGQRHVFKVDEVDKLEEDLLLWQGVAAATATGIPLEVALKRRGFNEKEILEMRGTMRRQQTVAQRRAALEAINSNAPQPETEQNNERVDNE